MRWDSYILHICNSVMITLGLDKLINRRFHSLQPEERNAYLLVISMVIFYAHMFCDRISYSEKLEMNYLPLLIKILKVFRLRYVPHIHH